MDGAITPRASEPTPTSSSWTKWQLWSEYVRLGVVTAQYVRRALQMPSSVSRELLQQIATDSRDTFHPARERAQRSAASRVALDAIERAIPSCWPKES